MKASHATREAFTLIYSNYHLGPSFKLPSYISNPGKALTILRILKVRHDNTATVAPVDNEEPTSLA